MKSQTSLQRKSSDAQLSKAIRILSADAVERAKSGHPGMPIGFADIFTALATKYLKYNPQDPRWHGRDRLVLSAGHGSMLLYSFFFLSGYEDYDLEQLKNFRQIGYHTAGHPEYDGTGPIEVTTGPLGQGFANSVGIAIAQKKYEQKLGKLMDYKTYCICGDGCLMEGISYEAASIAGHLGLNNLIVLFDDNNITIDGDTTLSTSENHIERFKASGWNTISVDGHDSLAIEEALDLAQNSDKPFFIAFKTKIGYMAGSKSASNEAHGSPLGLDAISALRKNLEWDYEPFEIPNDILQSWRSAWKINEDFYDNWQKEFAKLPPHLREYLEPANTDLITSKIEEFAAPTDKSEATRNSSGKLLEIIQLASDKVILGSCDLGTSTCVLNKDSKAITKDDFSGNFIHYGIRENAMGAIMNGLATQNFLPIGSSFLVFSDYMRPSIRLSCLMNLKVIYIMTHDSIGLGEDGPTHQPVEHLASLRAIPNLNLYRPADAHETQGAFEHIMHNHGPALLALGRQKVKSCSNRTLKDLTSKGAYILDEDSADIDVSIWASGSEVEIAIETASLLRQDGIRVRIISCPNLGLFFEQEISYQDKLRKGAKLTCAIEAASRMGWDRIIGDGMFFGMNSFGKSGPGDELYEYFNISAKYIASKIIKSIVQI